MVESFSQAVSRFPQRPCLGHRQITLNPQTGIETAGPYIWQSYQQIDERRKSLGAGLLQLHKQVTGSKSVRGGWNLGIYSKNRPEWIIADLAATANSVTIVPLYDTLGPNAVQFILTQAEPPIVVCSLDKVSTFLQLSSHCPLLKAVICMDVLDGYNSAAFRILKDWAGSCRITLVTFDEVEQLGKRFPTPFILPTPSDIALISYTSGTTGDPKGYFSLISAFSFRLMLLRSDDCPF
jgi:long-chain acyl-CoA synthetase